MQTVKGGVGVEDSFSFDHLVVLKAYLKIVDPPLTHVASLMRDVLLLVVRVTAEMQ